MTRCIHKQPKAKRDLVAHFAYLVENAGLDIADGFLANAESSFSLLAAKPMIGSPLAFGKPELACVRKWHVKDFEKYLIFYTPLPDGVSIVRVLHAAQDWWGLFGYKE